MITVFWDCEGVILLVALLRWETVNYNTYVRTQNLGSISDEFALTRIQQKSCFSKTMQGRTQV